MPTSQRIFQDGKEYEFTPGENGSLIAKGQPPAAPGFNFNPPAQRAKVIGPGPGADQALGVMPPRPRIAKVIGPNKGAEEMMSMNDDQMKDQLLQELIDQMDQRDAKRLPGMEEMSEDDAPPMDEEAGGSPMGGGEPDMSSLDPRLVELLKSRMGA